MTPTSLGVPGGLFSVSSAQFNFKSNGNVTVLGVNTLPLTGGAAGTTLTVAAPGAFTQSGANTGLSIDQSTNVTTPNSAAGNQTGISIISKDGGVSATSTGISLAGTADTGILFGAGISTLLSGTNFSVNQAGAIVGVGVNSGTGLIQGSGGLTLATGSTFTNASSTLLTALPVVNQTANGNIPGQMVLFCNR